MGSDKDIITNGGMPFLTVFTCSTEGYAMKHDTFFTNLARFSNYSAHAMVTEEAPIDPGPRVNFNAGQESIDL